MFRCIQSHVIQCPQLKSRILVDSKCQLSENDIYGYADQQLLYVKVYKEIWDLRARILEERKKEQIVVTNVTPGAPDIDIQYSVLQ